MAVGKSFDEPVDLRLLDIAKHCDRHGKRRVRFRKAGFSTYLIGTPWSEDFMRQYASALDGVKAQATNIGWGLLSPPTCKGQQSDPRSGRPARAGRAALRQFRLSDIPRRRARAGELRGHRQGAALNDQRFREGAAVAPMITSRHCASSSSRAWTWMPSTQK